MSVLSAASAPAPSPTRAHVSLRWLIGVRWGAALIQTLVILWARFVLDRPLTNCAHPNPPPPLARINASSPSGTGAEICIEPEMAIVLWS